MRFASLKDDYWQLESGVERQRKYGDKFWLPSEEERTNLVPGMLAKLLFQMEGEHEDGEVELVTERMWVLLTEVHAEYYLGRLVNQPAFVEPEDDFYLQLGAEIPFGSDQVTDIHQWARSDVDDFLQTVVPKRWV